MLNNIGNAMSVRRILKDVLVDWKEFGYPGDLIKRQYKIPLNTKSITVLTGVRRCGKTYLMFQLMRELIESGVDESRIFYINFEDERITPQSEFLTELIPAIKETFNVSGKLYLFLDEIHNIPNWDKWLRRHELRDIKFIISGSTSELTPGEIPKSLGGRTETYVIHPLSFREFLKFQNVRVNKNLEFSERRYEILRLLKIYLEYGGFPEIVLLKDKRKKLMKLQEYFSAIIYRDIVKRRNVAQVAELEILLKLLADTTLFSASKMENLMKNFGYRISKATVLKYKAFAEKAFFIHQLSIFSRKIKDVLQYPRRIYFIDTGLRRAISRNWGRSFGNMLENLVYLFLLRNKKAFTNLAYWRSPGNLEVDLVIESNLRAQTLVQVCYDVADEKTKKREEKSLLKALKEFGLKQGYIITWDYEEKKTLNEKTILYIPFWKLALGIRQLSFD